MNETNLLAVLTALALTYTNTVWTTNWIGTGNFSRRDNTNYLEQYMGEVTQTEIRKVARPRIVWDTNEVVIKYSRELFSRTNGVLRVIPSDQALTPGLPTKL